MKILPGLTFSWRRAIGLTRLMTKISRTTGIPMTRGGIERKIGRVVLNALFGKRR